MCASPYASVKFGARTDRYPRISSPSSASPRPSFEDARSPDRTCMFAHLWRTYYWPLMVDGITSTVRCTCNCFFSSIWTSWCVCIPQSINSSPSHSIYWILFRRRKSVFDSSWSWMIAKRTQVVSLKRSTGLDVVKAFASHWTFKYGAPMEVLSENGPQLARKLYYNKCRILSISKNFTSAYYTQTNGQAERFNRSNTEMLDCYVLNHLENWDEYA